MKEIYFELNDNYKSFPQNFNAVLEGDLIILSGINGSGKSQILNILQGKIIVSIPSTTAIPGQKMRKTVINRNLFIDKVDSTDSSIEYRSYKDNISIPEIIKTNSTLFISSPEQAYEAYINNSFSNLSISPFKKSIQEAIEILGPLYDSQKRDIPKETFIKMLADRNFVWKSEDSFSDTIGNIFYIHATEIAQGQQNAGKIDGPAFDPSTLGLAPWVELNSLFEILKLDYRFKDNYEISNFELNETPRLFQIDSKGVIIETESRELADLSDGEKTIISLCFNSLAKNIDKNLQLLLLDEFDAVLNPSLIEIFFIVLERYFIKKGITVILTTHSSATIALAPDYTSYYEVFKSNIFAERIKKIDRDNYLDLKKVNKRFYDQINDQSKRIKELEETIESDKPVTIITEGKTDWKYILKALEHFQHKGEFLDILPEYFFRYGNEDDVARNVCGSEFVADLSESQLLSILAAEISSRAGNIHKRKQIKIGIFDSDTPIKLKEKREYGIYSFKIEPDGISTEFLFYEDKIKTEVAGERLFIGTEFNERTTSHIDKPLHLGNGSGKKAGSRVIIDTDVYNQSNENQALSKEKFAQAIFNGEIEITDGNWENFRHIFDNISAILKHDRTL